MPTIVSNDPVELKERSTLVTEVNEIAKQSALKKES
jgi:hypothetical protein